MNSINGLPLHPLATHAAVVLVPLACLLGTLFAVPRTRRWATVPLPITASSAAVATLVSVRSGEALQRVGGLGATGLDGDVGRLVLVHAERADLLHVLVWVYAAVAVLAAVSQHPSIRQRQKVGAALGALLVVGAVVLVVQTVRVGETGARAVWNPAGGVDYSSDG